jgi:uncharacterized protein YkwD
MATFIPSTARAVPRNAPDASEGLDLAAIRDSVLSKHNAYRKAHGSPDLTASASLDASAQAWADKLAESGQFLHSGGEYGENLYSISANEELAADAIATNAVDAWYNEGKSYDFASAEPAPNTFHFTQLLWKGSTELGVGVGRATKGDDADAIIYYVVCQYTPTGNISGAWAENVLPRR